MNNEPKKRAPWTLRQKLKLAVFLFVVSSFTVLLFVKLPLLVYIMSGACIGAMYALILEMYLIKKDGGFVNGVYERMIKSNRIDLDERIEMEMFEEDTKYTIGFVYFAFVVFLHILIWPTILVATGILSYAKMVR